MELSDLLKYVQDASIVDILDWACFVGISVSAYWVIEDKIKINREYTAITSRYSVDSSKTKITLLSYGELEGLCNRIQPLLNSLPENKKKSITLLYEAASQEKTNREVQRSALKYGVSV